MAGYSNLARITNIEESIVMDNPEFIEFLINELEHHIKPPGIDDFMLYSLDLESIELKKKNDA